MHDKEKFNLTQTKASLSLIPGKHAIGRERNGINKIALDTSELYFSLLMCNWNSA